MHLPLEPDPQQTSNLQVPMPFPLHVLVQVHRAAAQFLLGQVTKHQRVQYKLLQEGLHHQ